MTPITPKLRDILVNDPVTLMRDKLNHFLKRCDKKKLNFKHISEIGTFCGGTAHLLAQHYPNAIINTVDINCWEDYFLPHRDNEHIRQSVQQHYRELYDIELRIPEQIAEIQSFYESQNPNLTLHQNHLDLTGSDLIIVDGDHTVPGIRRDFEQIVQQAPGAILFCDDTHISYIFRTIQKMAKLFNYRLSGPHWYRQYTILEPCVQARKRCPYSNGYPKKRLKPPKG